MLIALALALAAQHADTVVKNAGAPVHGGVAAVTREVRIGATDGADEYTFGDVSEIAVARDGSIYVFDRQAPALRKYDAAGKYIKTFGRKGQGPGEYLAAGGLAVMADGRVLLWDTGNWRINVYQADGTVLPSWSTLSGASGSASLGTSRSLLADTSGSVFIQRRLFTAARGRGIMGSPSVWIRYGPDGVATDTLPMPSFSSPSVVLSATSPGGGSTTSSPVPFAAVPVWARSPLGYLVTGIPDRYAFEIHTSATRVISVRRDAKAAPVTSQERDSARASIVERMRRTEPAWTWTGPDIPKTKPSYANIFTGDDGRIWIAVVAEVSRRLGSISSPQPLSAGRPSAPPPPVPSALQYKPPPPKPALYDVFEPNGTYVGQVEIPPNFSSAVRRGDYLWGVDFNEDDVAFVSRYKIQWK